MVGRETRRSGEVEGSRKASIHYQRCGGEGEYCNFSAECETACSIVRSHSTTRVKSLSSLRLQVRALDREVKYLLNKAKYAKPPKAKNTTSSSNATKEEAGESADKSEKEGEEETDKAVPPTEEEAPMPDEAPEEQPEETAEERREDGDDHVEL